MAEKSRLGRGLGALFPSLPGEEKSIISESSSKTTEKVEGEQAAKKRSVKKTDIKQSVKTASSNNKAANVSRETSSKKKRVSVPGFDDIAHPSDLFFGDKSDKGNVSRETLQKEQKNQSEVQEIAGGYLAEIALDQIMPNEHQPRTIFDQDELTELSASLKEVGVLQPIVVRKHTPTKDKPEPYELIMGERRWRASKLAGFDTIPAIVKTTADDKMLRDALLENLHRVALNPLEEAAAYQQMLDEFGLTQDELAKSVSKSRPQISNTLRLMNLPASIQNKVAAGVLSAGHARALLSLDSEEDMLKLSERIIAEGLSVRSVEEIVALKTSADAGKKKPQTKRTSIWENSPYQQRLEDRLDTKVVIKGTKKHGKIEIVFSSEEDIQRIIDVITANQTSSSDWV